jgi:hypothetical protein
MCFGLLLFVFLAHSSEIGYSITAGWLDQGVGVAGAVSKPFGRKSVDDNWDGLNV